MLPPPGLDAGRETICPAPETANHAAPKAVTRCPFVSTGFVSEDVPLVVEFHNGDPVSELSQAGEAATSGAAVATVARTVLVGVSAARLAATSRSTATASLARSG